MAIDPKRVAMQVAVRTLQMRGSKQVDLAANYDAGTTGTLTQLAAVLDGADVPVGALVDAVLAVEAELVEIIANDKVHPYRSLFYGRSDDLPHASNIPAESDELLRFVGIFSGICDSDDNMPLSEGTLQEINRFHRRGYAGEVRKYNISSNRIYHTRDSVYFEGCVWSRSIARGRFAEDSLAAAELPDSLEGAWVARTIEFLVQEGWLQAEGSYYGAFAQGCIARLRSRNLEMPQLPSVDSTPNPQGN